MNATEAKPLLDAFYAGKTLQVKPISMDWTDAFEDPFTWAVPINIWEKSRVRVKPEPRKVPLEMSDIDLHRDLFRHEDEDDPITAWSVGNDSVWLGVDTTGVCFSELKKSWERSTDGGKTWAKCEKEVV